MTSEERPARTASARGADDAGVNAVAAANNAASPPMHLRLRLLVACVALAIALGLPGCSGVTLTCGPGTHVEGTQCLPDVGHDAGLSIGDVGTASDAGAERDAGTASDAGPEIVDSSSPPDAAPDAGRFQVGDPCPQLHDACVGAHVLHCVLIPGDPRFGTLIDGLIDCSLLDGSCTVNAAGSASCTGGGYTPCPPGGRRCYDDHVLALCSTVWTAQDCADPAGDVCREIPDPDHPGQTVAACAPPL